MPRRVLKTGTALLAAATLALLGATTTPADAAPSNPSHPAPALGGAAAGGSVIVVLKDQHSGLKLRSQGAARRAATRADQKPLVADIRAHGGSATTQLVSVNAVAATVSAAEVARLRSDPAVKQVIPDETVEVQSAAVPNTAPPADLDSALCPTNPNKPLLEPEALSDIHATSDNPDAKDEANRIATGKGVVVAIDGMNELAGNPNFIRPDGSHVVIDAPNENADASNDEAYGDASSVAGQGTVVYDFSKELPYSGLPAGCTFTLQGDAPGASLVDTSLIDTPPSDANNFMTETEAQVVAGIDNAVVNDHADVISESYGYRNTPGSYAIHYAANDAAVAAGVTVVVSSGDSGSSGTVSSPASDPLVIAAAATNTLRENAQAYGYTKWTNDNITPLSSGGTTPGNKVVDIAAPGYGGEAACNPAGSGCPTNTITEAFGGTSQSAPLVAGAAADVIQAYRDTHGGASPTPEMVKEILVGSATDVDSPADEQGAGLLNIYAAVRAAQQMPGSTKLGQTSDSTSLVPSPTQLDVAGNGGTTTTQDVTLYNASARRLSVKSSFRALGPAVQLGSTVTEPVTAPDPSLPVPAEGAPAADPIHFTVPAGVDRMTTDMIWPDPTNAAILSYDLIDPNGALTQISYDYGTPATRPGVTIGSVPDIGQTEVADPVPGQWTAIIRWANGRSHLQEPPNVPGTYRGTLSFRVTGADYVTTKAASAVGIAPNSSATIPLKIRFPGAAGDHPESVQFTTDKGTTSVPIARRTLIPASGGSFDTLITSTVGRGVGQISTYNVDVAPGTQDLDVNFHTPDASPDNKYTFWLVDPNQHVVAEDATPTTTLQGIGSSTPTAKASLVTANPIPGRWEIDVELNLTTSGQEFTQTVFGTYDVNKVNVTVDTGLPTSPATVINPASPRLVTLSVKNTTGVGRSFSLTASAGDITGGAASTPVYIPAGASALLTTTITPTAAPGTVVTGNLNVISNDSSTARGFTTQTLAVLPYTYTAGGTAAA